MRSIDCCLDEYVEIVDGKCSVCGFKSGKKSLATESCIDSDEYLGMNPVEQKEFRDNK